MMRLQHPIILLTGGTGGHVIPAEVVAQACLKEGKSVHLITDTRGVKFLEKNPSYDLTVLSLASGSFLKRLWGVIKGAVALYFQFRKLKPTLIIGFGGYPSAAGAMASLFIKSPLYLYEQNAILGRVNRYFLPFAQKLFTSFPHTLKIPFYVRKKPLLIGPIVRPVFLEKEKQDKKSPENFTFVVFGGSQGANNLVKSTVKGLCLLPMDLQKKVHLILQVPASLTEWVEEESKPLHLKKFDRASFFSDMHIKIKEASFLMTRAGASTVGEILAVHKPCLFVPFPYAMDQHQVENAKRLTDLGLGWFVLDQDLTPSFLAKKIESFLQNPGILREKENAFNKRVIPFRPENSLEKFLKNV